MRVLSFATFLTTVWLSTAAPVWAAIGRVDVPPDMVPRLAFSTITNVFGVPLGKITADGSFSLPTTLYNDIEIVFVRPNASGDVILMGYGDGDRYNIGIEGTALALLLMNNPANGALDINGKHVLINTARAQPDFPELAMTIRHMIDNNTNLTTTADSQVLGLMARIQSALPQPRMQEAAYDQLMQQNNY